MENAVNKLGQVIRVATNVRRIEEIGLFEIAAKVVSMSSEDLRKHESGNSTTLPTTVKPPEIVRPDERPSKGIPLVSSMLALATAFSLAAAIYFFLSRDSNPQGSVALTETVSEQEISVAPVAPAETPTVSCDESQKAEEGGCYRDLARSTLVIGVLSSPDRYQPLADYLRSELGSDLMDVIVEGDSDISYQDAKNQIAQQNWDLVFAYSPMNSMAAHDIGYQWVARMFPDFPPFYQSVLYVRADSPINSIADLNSSHTIQCLSFY